MDIEFVRNVLVLERDLNLGQNFLDKNSISHNVWKPQKVPNHFQIGFYLILHRPTHFPRSQNFSDFYSWPIRFISKKVPEKEELERVAEQLGLQGKLNGGSKINEFWVNLQKEPKTGRWLWNGSTENVLKYTYNNFGQYSMLKGKVHGRSFDGPFWTRIAIRTLFIKTRQRVNE